MRKFADQLLKHPRIRVLLPYVAGLTIMFFSLLSHDGLPVASDINIHYSQSIAFLESLVDSPGYPDWNAMEAGLRGSPTFRFAGPLPLLVTALLQLIGICAATSLKLTPVFFAFIGAVGIQQWFKAANWKFDKLAVFLFLTSPILAINTRFLFFFQNTCAVLLVPWLIYAWEQNRAQSFNKNSGAAALGIILLCHIQTGVMIACILFICAIVESISNGNFRPFKTFVVINLIAMMLAGPYLFPVLFSQNLIKAPEIGLSLNPGRGSLFLDDSFSNTEGMPMSRIDGLLSLLTYATSNQKQPAYQPHSWEIIRPWFFWVVVLWLILSAAGHFMSENKEQIRAYSIAGLAASCLAFSFTRFIWPLIPAGHAIQFAFRWVFPASILLLPAITGIANLKNKTRLLLLLLVGPAIMSSLLIKASLVFPAGHEQSFAINRVTIEEMLPVTVPSGVTDKLKPLSRIHQLYLQQSQNTIHGVGGFSHFVYDLTEEAYSGPFVIMTYFDPFWRASINGKNSPLAPNKSGYIVGMLPQGAKSLELYRVAPDGRGMGWLAALVAIIMIAYAQKRGLESEKDSLN